MSMMIFEVYDALKAAGATEDKARKAAEAPAVDENRFGRIEADLNTLKWRRVFNLALSVGILFNLKTAVERARMRVCARGGPRATTQQGRPL